MRPEHRPDSTQLENMVSHIGYEAAAIEASVERFSACDDRFIMEASLLHARLLREFLWGNWEDSPRYKESSVYAEDYFTDPSHWRERKGPLLPALKESKGLIDKQLAHVCRERAEPDFTKDLGDKLPQLRDELLEQWRRFIEALDQDTYAGKLEAARLSWCNNLRTKGAT